MQNKDISLNKENIVYFKLDSRKAGEILKKDLSNNSDILGVTFADQNPCSVINGGSSKIFQWEGKKEGNDVMFSAFAVDDNFDKTFQLKIIEGRFFSSEFSTDNTAMVINEQAARFMGFKDPIGKTVTINGPGPKLRIIGVVKDFNFKSLHTGIEPLIMMKNNSENPFCFIKIRPDHIGSAVGYIKQTFKTYNLNYPLEINFLDDYYNNLYKKEQRMSKIFGYFSFLAIFISCLGLIGLSSLMTERRTKEIGIRKINGAKSIEIFSLLSGEYIMWVIISIIIACPIAWYVMNKWLQNFAYRINIGLWVFALAGVIALLIAFLTVSWQSYRAASKNPVEALRYE
jgi:ABC-type antimicrobial peptide transport system permease subunit